MASHTTYTCDGCGVAFDRESDRITVVQILLPAIVRGDANTRPVIGPAHLCSLECVTQWMLTAAAPRIPKRETEYIVGAGQTFSGPFCPTRGCTKEPRHRGDHQFDRAIGVGSTS